MRFTRTDSVASTALVIDSDPLMLTALGAVLDMQGHRCVLARTEALAMASITAGQFDLIILSIDELQQGCQFAARLRAPEANRDVPIIFLVPQLAPHWLSALSAHGGVYCLLKPVDPSALLDLVDKALWLPHVAAGRGPLPAGHLTAQPQADWVTL